MKTRRILFVDDEPMILSGLEARLFPYRRRWQMAFAGSGAAALELMEAQRFDVIVSDMRMPGMDGPALLREVHARHPQTVRVVLSGQADPEVAVRAVPLAHRFLAKPCDAGELEATVEHACRLRDVIGGEEVRTIVGRVEQLPPFPRLYTALVDLLHSDRFTAHDIARVLGQDMAMCAKILQLVNSAFFRLSRRITRVEEAVAYLGTGTLKRLVLAAEVFGYRGTHRPRAATMEALQEHALWVARAAAALTPDERQRDDAFMAGLLHDIGKLVLLAELPDLYSEVILAAAAAPCAFHEAELDLCGTTHAEIGGYLLGLWGLPDPIIEAVANHHAPERCDPASFDLAAATMVANGLVEELSQEFAGAEPARSPGHLLDGPYLARIGVVEHLPRWREMAAQLGPDVPDRPDGEPSEEPEVEHE